MEEAATQLYPFGSSHLCFQAVGFFSPEAHDLERGSPMSRVEVMIAGKMLQSQRWGLWEG